MHVTPIAVQVFLHTVPLLVLANPLSASLAIVMKRL